MFFKIMNYYGGRNVLRPYNDNGMPMGTDVLIGILVFA